MSDSVQSLVLSPLQREANADVSNVMRKWAALRRVNHENGDLLVSGEAELAKPAIAENKRKCIAKFVAWRLKKLFVKKFTQVFVSALCDFFTGRSVYRQL